MTRPTAKFADADSIKDLEVNKFLGDDNDDVAVRTVVSSGNLEFTFSGLSEAIKITTLDVTDTATALPATPLNNRNSISIRNLDNTETLYIGDINLTADAVNGTTSGWEVPPQESLNFDIANDVTVYGRAETGKSIKVKILEMA